MSSMVCAVSKAASCIRSRLAWLAWTPEVLPVSNSLRKPLCRNDLIMSGLYHVAHHATIGLTRCRPRIRGIISDVQLHPLCCQLDVSPPGQAFGLMPPRRPWPGRALRITPDEALSHPPGSVRLSCRRARPPPRRRPAACLQQELARSPPRRRTARPLTDPPRTDPTARPDCRHRRSRTGRRRPADTGCRAPDRRARAGRRPSRPVPARWRDAAAG